MHDTATLADLPLHPKIIVFKGRRMPTTLIPGLDHPAAPRQSYLSIYDCCVDYTVEHCVPTGGDPRRAWIAFYEWIDTLGGRFDCQTISRGNGRAVSDHALWRKVSTSTARKHLIMGIAALSHAKTEGRYKGDLPEFWMPDDGTPRAFWLTQEKVDELMRLQLPRRRELFWLLAFQTGARTGAIETLPWERVDLVNRVIDFREPGVNHKNKRRPLAPINDILLPRLISAKEYAERETPDDPYVIGVSPRTGRPTSTYNGCKKDMQAIGINIHGIARHVARHTFCSLRVQKGFSYAFIGKLVGDRAAMIEEVYGHLAPHHLMAASNMDTSALRSMP